MDETPRKLPFSTVAVLGPGLLGGSIAKAVREHMRGCELRLWARRKAPLLMAEEMGITRRTCLDIQDAVRGADLIILATPIGVFPDLAECMIPALSPGALVTDVGSVKGSVHHSAGERLTRAGHFFIGSHPMAGAESQGLEHARAELLRGAVVALTNPHNAPAELLERLTAFWRELGCRTCELSPEQHDAAVARISHLPHILAALGARNAVGGNVPDDRLQMLAATGFRDTTRVSAGGAAMWTDILSGNRNAVLSALQDSIEDLRRLAMLLEQQDTHALCAWLEEARQARERIIPGSPNHHA